MCHLDQKSVRPGSSIKLPRGFKLSLFRFHTSPLSPSPWRYHWFSQAMVYLLKETWLFFASSKTIYFLSKIRWKNIGGNPLQWKRRRAYFLSADAIEAVASWLKIFFSTFLQKKIYDHLMQMILGHTFQVGGQTQYEHALQRKYFALLYHVDFFWVNTWSLLRNLQFNLLEIFGSNKTFSLFSAGSIFHHLLI